MSDDDFYFTEPALSHYSHMSFIALARACGRDPTGNEPIDVTPNMRRAILSVLELLKQRRVVPVSKGELLLQQEERLAKARIKAANDMERMASKAARYLADTLVGGLNLADWRIEWRLDCVARDLGLPRETLARAAKAAKRRKRASDQMRREFAAHRKTFRTPAALARR